MNLSEETFVGANRRQTVVNLLSVSGEATSPAAAGYQRSTAVTGLLKYSSLVLLGTITGATGGTLDVVVETSFDGTDYYELARFTQAAAGATLASYRYEISRGVGTTQQTTGKNLTTTTGLTSGTAANGQWGDWLRVRMIAGTSTSAGAAQAVSVVGTKDN